MDASAQPAARIATHLVTGIRIACLPPWSESPSARARGPATAARLASFVLQVAEKLGADRSTPIESGRPVGLLSPMEARLPAVDTAPVLFRDSRLTPVWEKVQGGRRLSR